MNIKKWSILLVLLLMSRVTQAADQAALNAKVAELASAVDKLGVSVSSAFARLDARIGSLQGEIDLDNSGKGSILVGGIMQVVRGNTIQWPIAFIAGSVKTSALQADIQFPAGVTFQSIAPGPAAIAAGKQIQTASVNGSQRILVFGLNVTEINSGILGVATLQIDGSLAAGLRPLIMANPVASDGSGNPVILSLTSGTLDVR